MEHRQTRRIAVDIPVTMTSVLDLLEASIVDLTENGAQIQGVALPEGTRFQIEYRGQTIFAQCRWSEIDRMGVKFLFPLVEGPLYERLLMARAAPAEGPLTGPNMAFTPQPLSQARPAVRFPGRPQPPTSFGRRG